MLSSTAVEEFQLQSIVSRTKQYCYNSYEHFVRFFLNTNYSIYFKHKSCSLHMCCPFNLYGMTKERAAFMLSKLLQIFFVLALGTLLACFFSIPVRKINYLLGKNIPILKHRKKTRNIISVFIWYGLLLVFLFLIVGLLYYNIYQYFSKIS